MAQNLQNSQTGVNMEELCGGVKGEGGGSKVESGLLPESGPGDFYCRNGALFRGFGYPHGTEPFE